MRHGKRFNHLGRTASHRKAMLSNMASSLILHKRISTTVAKAKELRKYVEPLITKSKDDTTHSRRTVFSYLQNKESVHVLFDEVAEKVATRPGGYTRIIRTGSRLGDNAELCIVELVDYNELLLADAGAAASRKKTRRRGKKSSSSTATAPSDTPKATEEKIENDIQTEKVEPKEAREEPVKEQKAQAEKEEQKIESKEEEGKAEDRSEKEPKASSEEKKDDESDAKDEKKEK